METKKETYSAADHPLLRKARSHELAGQTKGASKAYREWADAIATVDAYLYAASKSHALRDLNRAQYLYEQARRLDPDDSSILESLRTLATEKGDGLANKATHSAPTKPTTESENGGLVKLLEQARSTGTPQAYLQFAEYAAKHGYVDMARASLRRAMKDFPDNNELSRKLKALDRTETDLLDITDELNRELDSGLVQVAFNRARSWLEDQPTTPKLASIYLLFDSSQLLDDFLQAFDCDTQNYAVLQWIAGRLSNERLISTGVDLSAALLVKAEVAEQKGNPEAAQKLREEGEPWRSTVRHYAKWKFRNPGFDSHLRAFVGVATHSNHIARSAPRARDGT